MVSVLYSHCECSLFTTISSIPTSYSGLSFAKKSDGHKKSRIWFHERSEKKKPRILSSLRLLYEILDIFLIHALHNYNNGRTVYVLFLEFVIESYKFQ